jgi:hypothetical protein
LRFEQASQRRDQLLIIALPLLARGLDARQHLAHGVDRGEHCGRDFGREWQQAIPQARKQALSRVGHGFQVIKCKEAGSPLDGVDGSENAR